jgi:hypothetical protein
MKRRERPAHHGLRAQRQHLEADDPGRGVPEILQERLVYDPPAPLAGVSQHDYSSLPE